MAGSPEAYRVLCARVVRMARDDVEGRDALLAAEPEVCAQVMRGLEEWALRYDGADGADGAAGDGNAALAAQGLEAVQFLLRADQEDLGTTSDAVVEALHMHQCCSALGGNVSGVRLLADMVLRRSVWTERETDTLECYLRMLRNLCLRLKERAGSEGCIDALVAPAVRVQCRLHKNVAIWACRALGNALLRCPKNQRKYAAQAVRFALEDVMQVHSGDAAVAQYASRVIGCATSRAAQDELCRVFVECNASHLLCEALHRHGGGDSAPVSLSNKLHLDTCIDDMLTNLLGAVASILWHDAEAGHRCMAGGAARLLSRIAMQRMSAHAALRRHMRTRGVRADANEDNCATAHASRTLFVCVRILIRNNNAHREAFRVCGFVDTLLHLLRSGLLMPPSRCPGALKEAYRLVDVFALGEANLCHYLTDAGVCEAVLLAFRCANAAQGPQAEYDTVLCKACQTVFHLACHISGAAPGVPSSTNTSAANENRRRLLSRGIVPLAGYVIHRRLKQASDASSTGSSTLFLQYKRLLRIFTSDAVEVNGATSRKLSARVAAPAFSTTNNSRSSTLLRVSMGVRVGAMARAVGAAVGWTRQGAEQRGNDAPPEREDDDDDDDDDDDGHNSSSAPA